MKKRIFAMLILITITFLFSIPVAAEVDDEGTAEEVWAELQKWESERNERVAERAKALSANVLFSVLTSEDKEIVLNAIGGSAAEDTAESISIASSESEEPKVSSDQIAPLSAPALEETGSETLNLILNDRLSPESEYAINEAYFNIQSETGYCGKDDLSAAKWILDDNGTVTIEGKGDTEDVSFSEDPRVKKVVVKSGINEFKFDFSGCPNLTELYIESPNYMAHICSRRYAYCPALKKVTIGDMAEGEGTELNHYCFYMCPALEEVNIGRSVWHFGEHTFAGCTALKNIKLSDDMHDLIANNFSGCTNLTSMSIAESNQWMMSRDGVMYKIDDAYDRSYIKEPALLTVPNGIVRAAGGNYTVKKGVKSIERGAMDGVSDLKNITIASTVELIGQEAFFECRNLKSVAIPKAVKSIGDNAFGVYIDRERYGSNFNYEENTDISPSITDVYYEGSESEWKQIKYEVYNHKAVVSNIEVKESGTLYDNLDIVGLPEKVTIHYNTPIVDTEEDLNADPAKLGDYKVSKYTTAIALPVKSPKIEIALDSDETFQITGGAKKGVVINAKKKLLTAKKPGEYLLTITNSKGEKREIKIYVEKPVMKKYVARSLDKLDISKMLSGLTHLKPSGYKSSKPNVADIDSTGQITVKNKGATKIFVFFGKKKVKAALKVKL